MICNRHACLGGGKNHHRPFSVSARILLGSPDIPKRWVGMRRPVRPQAQGWSLGFRVEQAAPTRCTPTRPPHYAPPALIYATAGPAPDLALAAFRPKATGNAVLCMASGQTRSLQGLSKRRARAQSIVFCSTLGPSERI